tara:strand:+ start:675 stop:791 length:117 start_codon:yes stop_codon:yes gene_type:complete
VVAAVGAALEDDLVKVRVDVRVRVGVGVGARVGAWGLG